MAYIELYKDEVLETISLGKFNTNFNTNNGDYIKVEILSERNIVMQTLYSNKLLLQTVNGNSYVGDYHYHPENGFMEGEIHTDEQHSKLLPIPEDTSLGQDYSTFNPNFEYKKQFNIYYDDNNKSYLKPDEIIGLISTQESLYKLRIYVLRDLRTTIGNFLNIQKFNLIENGNFFAGLEATQTGDLDRSKGLNRFTRRRNPSLGRFVLEQTGAGDNEYDMLITGIEPDSHYMFSCWVGYNNKYEGDESLIQFDSAVTFNEESEPPQSNVEQTKTITVTLKGQYFGGWPHCKLIVNGNVLLGDFYVETDQYQDYTFEIPEGQMIDSNSQLEIGVTFDNDAYQPGGFDRNLYFKSIKGTNGKVYHMNGGTFNSSNPGETLLTEDNGFIEGSSVLYHHLPENGGEPRVTHSDANFLGEFRQVLAWGGEVKVQLNAADLFNFNEEEEVIITTHGLNLTPSNDMGLSISTDIFSSYFNNSEQTNELGIINRNNQTLTVDDIVWYQRFKLVSTTADATLGSLRLHLGKSMNLGTESSNTLGRRYFTDLRFQKIDNSNSTVPDYLNNLKTIWKLGL